MTRWIVTLALLPTLLPALPHALLHAAPLEASTGPAVQITSPGIEPVFGEVTFEATLEPDPDALRRVRFYVDGLRVGDLAEPPYRLSIDVGQDNREHEFRVIVEHDAGPVEDVVRTPAIRVDEELTVQLQQVYVTVSRGGRRVVDLGPESFTLRDNGVPQRIVTFQGGDVPLAAALLVDTSQSMAGERLEAALAGTRSFLSGMKELDEAAVMLFSHGLQQRTPYLADRDELDAALGAVEAAGNTAVNDNLYYALKELDARQGRRVLVLLSDGADLHSTLDMEDVLWKARRSPAMIFWIRLQEGGVEEGRFHTAWRSASENEAQIQALERAVRESGGTIVPVESTSEIEPAFVAILQELREQYAIGYYPSDNRDDGSWHALDVSVRGGGRVKARQGYVD